MPTRMLGLVPGKLTSHFMETWLRSYDPPVVTRVEKEQVLFDLRTIQERELKTVAAAVTELAGLERAAAL
jgi:seryl-tRNA(Sec) selenium transferase